MRRLLIAAAVVGIVASAASVGFTQAKPSAASPSLEGVWKSTPVIGTGPNASDSIKDRQPNINIWTKKYYSRVTADGPTRPVLAAPKNPANLTNAEKLSRYEHFRQVAALAGMYEIKGTQVILAPPKDPANLTNAEKLARYEHWAPGVAQAGRYEVKGATLYQYGFVAKNQGADIIERNKTGNLGKIDPNSELVFSNGNNTMVQIAKSPDGKSEMRRTYTRLE
jgi:hypothetical protein